MTKSFARQTFACRFGRIVASMARALAIALAAHAPAWSQEGWWKINTPVQHGARTFDLRGTEAARVLKFRLEQAQEAVRACRSDLYDREMDYLVADIAFFDQAEGVQIVISGNYDAAAALRHNIAEYRRALKFLQDTREHRFRDCRPPTTTTPPSPPGSDRRVGLGPETPRPQDRAFFQYNYFVNFGTGVQFDEIKPTTLGTLFVPGGDRPFLQSRGSATGFNFALSVGTPASGVWPIILPLFGQAGTVQETLNFGFNFSRTWTTASGSSGPGDVPVFTLVEPFAGVQSFGTGPIDATIKTSVNTTSFYVQDTLTSGNWSVNLGVRYERKETEQDGTINSLILSGFTINQVLTTNDNYIGPIFGAKYMTPLPIFIPGTNAPLVFDIKGWLSPSLRISDGSARQHVVIPGAAAPFNDFSATTDGSRVGFALLGGAEAGISAEITPSITARLSGGFRFNTAQSHWEMPLSPGQRARFNTDLQISQTVRFGVNFRF